jgi:hypothetical protein
VANHFGIFSGDPIELCIVVWEKWRCGEALAICDSGRGELWSRRVVGRSIRIADVMDVRRVRQLNTKCIYVCRSFTILKSSFRKCSAGLKPIRWFDLTNSASGVVCDLVQLHTLIVQCKNLPRLSNRLSKSELYAPV